MSRPLPVVAALERALDAHASALSGGDPAQLERCNVALSEALAALRRQVRGEGAPVPAGPADDRERSRIRARLVAHGALVARAARANHQARVAMGLAEDDPPHASPAARRGETPARRATHVLA